MKTFIQHLNEAKSKYDKAQDAHIKAKKITKGWKGSLDAQYNADGSAEIAVHQGQQSCGELLDYVLKGHFKNSEYNMSEKEYDGNKQSVDGFQISIKKVNDREFKLHLSLA